MHPMRNAMLKAVYFMLVIALIMSPGGVYAPNVSGAAASGSTDQTTGSLPSQPGAGSGPSASERNDLSSTRPGLPYEGFALEGQGQPTPVSPTGAVLSHYFIPGFAFHGRDSANTYASDSDGCVHRASTSGLDQLVAPVYLANGSVIKYMRLYYKDIDSVAGLYTWLTIYNPGVSTTDLIFLNNGVTSSGAGAVSSYEITHTVTTESYAYAIEVYSGAANSNLQLCGVRVDYYAPPFGAALLPYISKP